jgi:hypothetical protein
MKNSIQCPDLGRLDVSFRLTAILPASELDEISRQKSPATEHPRDLSHFLESSFQAAAASQLSRTNSSSAAAVSEALALCFVLNASAAEWPEKE